jgi:hypothetical protein
MDEMNVPPGLKLKLMGTIGEIAAHRTGNSKWPRSMAPETSDDSSKHHDSSKLPRWFHKGSKKSER